MIGNTPIEFSKLFGCEGKLFFPLSVVKTFP